MSISCNEDDATTDEINNETINEEIEEGIDEGGNEVEEEKNEIEEEVVDTGDNSNNENNGEEQIDKEEPTIEEPTVSCSATYGDDYIAFEAEDTNSPLDQWNLISDGDDNYLDKEEISPINGTHIEFTGNNIGSGPATSPLEYVFVAPLQVFIVF